MSDDTENQDPATRLCPEPDGKKSHRVKPPEYFNEQQREYWFELFDLFNNHDVISFLDIPAFNLLVVSYTRAMHQDPLQPLPVSQIKTVYTMLAAFGCLPNSRHVEKVPKPTGETTNQMDIFRKMMEQTHGRPG